MPDWVMQVKEMAYFGSKFDYFGLRQYGKNMPNFSCLCNFGLTQESTAISVFIALLQ